MKFSDIRRDVRKIDSGDWVDQIPSMGNLRLKVRGMRSRVYREDRERRVAAIGTHDRDRVGTPNSAALQNATAEAAAATLLLDWENVLDEEGKPIPYSPALAKQVLTERESEVFLEAVLYAAQAVDLTLKASEETAAKN